MKKVGCIVIFLIILVTFKLNATNHYCVQILAYPSKEINYLKNDKKLYSFISSRHDCIIEPRQNGKYLGICCGDFSSYSKAANSAKKYFKSEFPNAFARKFNPKDSKKIDNLSYKKSLQNKNKIQKKIIKSENIPESVEVIRKPASKQIITTKRNKKVNPLDTKVLQASMNNFDKKITRNIVNNKSNSEYEIFSLKRYFHMLENSDLDFKSSKYDSRLYQVNSLIEADKYNPNIYFSAGSTVSKTYNVGSATNYASLNSLAAIYFDWHIYDAQKKYYTEERKIIFDKLSKLNILSAKDRLLINGSLIYMNLWYLQKIIDKYNTLLKQQEKLLDIARIKYETGDSNSIYETIDTQNDYFNLELAVSDIREMFIQQEYLFRQSIDLNSPKTIYLYDPVYKPIKSPVLELQKEAIANNKELAKLQEEYKLSKSDLALAAAQKGWNFDFFSYAGYGYSTEIEGTKDSGKGIEWQIGIRATYPLYSKNDIKLKINQKKLQVKKSALRVASKIKTLALTINKLYNSYKKLQYKSDIYKMQNKILKKRLDISFARYIRGEGTYKQYSDTLKIYTDSLRAKFLNDSFLHSTVLQLYILSGKNLY